MRILDATLWFLPVQMRVPLKFGDQVLTEVTCARVRVRVADNKGGSAEGWGETPLNVGWLWPSPIPYGTRHETLKNLCRRIARELPFAPAGHPMTTGHHLLKDRLPQWRRELEMPYLAALGCLSLFDIALHDAYGNLRGLSVYNCYGPGHLDQDLSAFLGPEFAGTYPADYLVFPAPRTLPVWHLVGGLDPLEPDDLRGDEPDDEYPVLLRDWIRRDGLKCLKIKLRGNDADWDYARLIAVGRIAAAEGVEHLTADFNCTVTDPAYVNDLLDQLERDEPGIHRAILYVEQPFPYELEEHPIDVRSVSARKPLYMDESAHDWQLVRRGRELGWTGVALKTCKTQTGALLSLCWAKHHGMGLMVQDLTNPMLAQIPHVQLAAHAGTIMGVESNGMQFYPAASLPEQRVHPGLYRRRGGVLDRGTLGDIGMGYRIDDIGRELPAPEPA